MNKVFRETGNLDRGWLDLSWDLAYPTIHISGNQFLQCHLLGRFQLKVYCS